jgi:hypothetical protein
MDTLEAITAANESTLKMVTAFQDQILDSYKELSPTLQSSLPSTLPAWIPAPEPQTTREVVEEAFAFRSRLLDANKAFALGLLDVWVPEASVARASTAKKK